MSTIEFQGEPGHTVVVANEPTSRAPQHPFTATCTCGITHRYTERAYALSFAEDHTTDASVKR